MKNSANMAEETWVSVEFLPSLRVKDGMIMIYGIIERGAEPAVTTRDL